MPPHKRQASADKKAEIIANARRDQTDRAKGYRERALAILPHVCGRCAREFSGKTLRELTVHHKDHDHSNNPPDGSNWELLCLYCHDDEHQTSQQKDHYDGSGPNKTDGPPLAHNPFAGLQNLLKTETDDTDSE